jgi:hypothetical protein
MKGQSAVTSAVVILTLFLSAARLNAKAPVSSFLGNHTVINDGSSLSVSAAYVPFENGSRFGYGRVSANLTGMLAATLSHEAVVGSPTGLLRPASQFDLRVLVLPQRDRLPSVALFLTGMLEKQSAFLSSSDLQPARADLVRNGLSVLTYDARTTMAGVSFSSSFDDVVTLGGSLGVREVNWQQKWSAYSRETGLPQIHGWTYPLAERSSLRVAWSAGVAYRPIASLTLVGDVASLPFIDVDPPTLQAIARTGYVAAIGVRYSLPIPVGVEVYDRWSSGSGVNRHEVRIGLRGDISLQ